MGRGLRGGRVEGGEPLNVTDGGCGILKNIPRPMFMTGPTLL